MESPRHSTLTQFGNKINVTVTYRLDSDVYHPYFKVEKRLKPKPYIKRVNFINKTKLVVWPVSHCHNPFSKRNAYVNELSKYIPIDIYGQCGPFKCPRSTHAECLRNFEVEYKFYFL